MPVVNGERLLICSDGLHSELPDEGIRATLTMSGKPESAAATLVQRAKAAGGRDNISVIVIDVVSGGSQLVGEFTTGAAAVAGDLSDPALDGTTIPVRG
jgi:serine/threonine protein phosphatase PrpC